MIKWDFPKASEADLSAQLKGPGPAGGRDVRPRQ